MQLLIASKCNSVEPLSGRNGDKETCSKKIDTEIWKVTLL